MKRFIDFLFVSFSMGAICTRIAAFSCWSFENGFEFFRIVSSWFGCVYFFVVTFFFFMDYDAVKGEYVISKLFEGGK